MRASRVLLIGLLLVAVPIVGCVEDPGTGDDGTADDGTGGGEAPDDGGADDGGGSDAVTEITVQASEWSLEPAGFTVPAGEEVTLTLENTGSNQHNWGVDLDGDGETEDDVRTDTIPSGETTTVTFTVDETGEYTFFCDVSGHRDAGMEGTLTVE
jgi:plastocyanin